MFRYLCLIMLGIVGFSSFPTLEARAQSQVIGVVKEVSGESVLVRAGRSIPATVGGDVHHSDQLRTGTDGLIGVALNDGSLISLGPNSLFELSAFQFAPQRGAFEFLGSFLRGTLLYSSGRIAKLAPSKARLKTPTAVVAIRGTRLAIRAASGGGN